MGLVDPPINFGGLWGQEGYTHKLHQLYTEQKVTHSIRLFEAPLRMTDARLRVVRLCAAVKIS